MTAAKLTTFCAVLLLSSVSGAGAETLAFQEGNGGAYSSTASTLINFTNPINFGSHPTLTVFSFEFETTVVSFVRFPDMVGNNAGQIPPGSTVSSAVFELTRTDNSTVVTRVHQVLSAWDEYTVTGGNWPDVAGTDFGPSMGTIGIGTPSSVGSVDVTSIVQAWVGGVANWGFLLRPTLGTFAMGNFHSDDSATQGFRPRLVVEFTSPPVPVASTTWGRIKALYR